MRLWQQADTDHGERARKGRAPIRQRSRTSGTRLVVLALAVSGSFGLLAAGAAADTIVQLQLSQSDAFSVLGHSCGGISEHAYATGFDATTGYPVGDVYLSTTCSTGGRGAPPHTYTAWAAVTWDYTGAAVSYGPASSVPAVSTTFSALDSYGNRLYNTSSGAYLDEVTGFVFAPRVISISTAQGPSSGGTAVTITGTGFTGVSGVSFGSVAAASYTVNGSTSITALAPSEPGGTVDVRVASAGGPSATSSQDRFTFVAPPRVTSVSPDAGPPNGGTAVTISGSGFTYATGVSFGENAAGFSVNNDSSITAFAPTSDGETGLVNVTVTDLGGASPTTTSDTFTYVASPSGPQRPQVTRISPRSGPRRGGTLVTIYGAHLTGVTSVRFGTANPNRFTIGANAQTITVRAPRGRGTVTVRVVSPAGTSAVAGAADRFTYVKRHRHRH